MLLIVLIIVILLWFASQGAATANLKRENKASFDRAMQNTEKWYREQAKEGDYYFDPILKSCDWHFYSDGSLKMEGDKLYPKGQYYCNSHGYGPMCRKVSPDTKRPPKN